jgi:hypothetical protein
VGPQLAVTQPQVARRELAEIMHPGWAAQLGGLEDRLAALGDYLRAEAAAGRRFLPAGDRILAAFQQPFERVRVLIVGQDLACRTSSVSTATTSAIPRQPAVTSRRGPSKACCCSTGC